jgi:hypothetical protein
MRREEKRRGEKRRGEERRIVPPKKMTYANPMFSGRVKTL